MNAHPNDPREGPRDEADELLGRQLARALRELPDAPEALQRAAIGLFPAHSALQTLAAQAGAAVRQLVAVLSFDSWAQPALAGGMRAAGSATRHLLFSAEGRDIDLRIAPEAGAWALAGQVLGPDESGRVELRPQAGAAAQSAALDGMGEFRIAGLAAGTYRLTLQLGADRIELPALDVGEPGG